MPELTRSIDGFELLGMQNEQVELWIAPGLGGKWVSLRDRRAEREWMWSPPEGKGLFRAPDNNAFNTSCLVGADECIPTIAPSQWQGRDLPDHGEVWNLPWEIADSHTADELTLRIEMPISPLRFTRRIRLQDATLDVAYTLENRGDKQEPFVWAFHPLLWIVPGDRLALGTGIRDLLLESAMGLDLGQRGDVCTWPSPQTGIDLTRLELGGDNRAAKFFTRRLAPTDNWARIYNEADQTALTYQFDTQDVTTLGIWLTRGGYNGYHHLAVEPGIGAPDPLDIAVNDWQHFGTVEPNGKKEWRFQLTVGE